MRETYRPFSKYVSITGTGAVEVTLHDSSGVALECNYIEVEPVSGTADSVMFMVVPDIPTSRTYASMPTAASITLNDTSGIVGGLASANTGVVTLSLASPDLTSKVKISHDTAGTIAYAVRYGVVQMANNLKDSRSSRGN